MRKARLIANSAATAKAAGETGWNVSVVVPLATGLKADTARNSHGPHVLFVGRLVERKGCRWFVERVLPQLPDGIDLRVAGTVWHEAERTALDHPRVTYLGAMSQDALIEEYRAALCVVVPNIEVESGEFEGFGLVATEAAAVGGVVLASACGGLTDAVIDGETGFLLPVGCAEAWRERIEEMAGWTEAQRAVFTANAIAKAQKSYCWQRVAEDVLGVYREGSTEE
jgi:glycosyltransferase involved in cell wall biosynthesis